MFSGKKRNLYSLFSIFLGDFHHSSIIVFSAPSLETLGTLSFSLCRPSVSQHAFYQCLFLSEIPERQTEREYISMGVLYVHHLIINNIKI